MHLILNSEDNDISTGKRISALQFNPGLAPANAHEIKSRLEG